MKGLFKLDRLGDTCLLVEEVYIFLYQKEVKATFLTESDMTYRLGDALFYPPGPGYDPLIFLFGSGFNWLVLSCDYLEPYAIYPSIHSGRWVI